MKVKFGFKKIYSESDTITVNAGDEQIMLFKKSDFNNDWQNLVNNGVIYEIAPYKAKPFQGKIFSRYFTPKSVLSLAIILIDVNGFYENTRKLNACFKFKDRDFEQKSLKINMCYH